MSADEHLNDIQFSVHTGGADKVGHGAVYAHQGSTLREHEGKAYRNIDNIVGKLSWGMEHHFGSASLPDRGGPHEIDEVWVHPERRHEGIATAMLGFAKSVSPEIQHSTKRTEKGDGWAQAQGAAPAAKRTPWHDRSGMSPD